MECVLSRGLKFLYIILERKKTNLQKTNFPQNVTVDKKNNLLTSLPKIFGRLFFAVSARKLTIWTLSSVLTRKRICWTRKTKFNQPSRIFLALSHETYIQSRRKKKQLFKIFSFFINVYIFLDNTSTFLTSLLKSFGKLFFAVSSRKLTIRASLFFSDKKNDQPYT